MNVRSKSLRIHICRPCKRVTRGTAGILQSWLGWGLASPTEIKYRLEVCNQCSDRVPCAENTRQACLCEVCGCHLKHKTRLKRESCPLGHWS